VAAGAPKEEKDLGNGKLKEKEGRESMSRGMRKRICEKRRGMLNVRLWVQ
jgi:hypothetical protein